MSMDIFETAVRQKVRFTTVKGQATVEDLFDMPLTSKSGFDLDTLAKSVNAELKAAGEESFVETTANPRRDLLALKLDLIKRVIFVKRAERELANQLQARAAERQKLAAILEQKKDAALGDLSVEELQKRLADLS